MLPWVKVLSSAAAVVWMAVGCGIIVKDDPLEAKLSALKDKGEAVRLTDLTEFTWDEVHLFNEYARKDVINDVVGSEVITADYHAAGSLLVFEDAGKVVKTVTVGGDYLRADEYTYGVDVLVKPWGNGAMRLEPSR